MFEIWEDAILHFPSIFFINYFVLVGVKLQHAEKRFWNEKISSPLNDSQWGSLTEHMHFLLYGVVNKIWT